MSTKIHRVHVSSPVLGVTITGAHEWCRARWATSLALLVEPPPELSYLNYYANTPEHLESSATSGALAFYVDMSWWRRVRLSTRVVYCSVERIADDGSTGWEQINLHHFIINHDPVANAGPDQLITLAADGRLIDDIVLDASASDDPDPGPLTYRWCVTDAPPTLGAGTVRDALEALPSTAAPVLLPAGTMIPDTGRGNYSFSVTVSDNDVATIGGRAGTRGSSTATTRLVIGSGGPRLTLITPTRESPALFIREDGGDVRILYSVGSEIAEEYAGMWFVKCTVTQSKLSDFFPGLLGEKVFEATWCSSRRRDDSADPIAIDTFVWRPSGVVGAFDVRLELLDGDFQSTGVQGAVVTETQAILIDLFRWLIPHDREIYARLTATFMESGHDGFENTNLHAAVDLGNETPVPQILAARSGRYSAPNTAMMQIVHPFPHWTRYRHANQMGYADQALVLQGSILGTVGKVGTDFPHLHFEHLIGGGPEDFPAYAENPLAILPLSDRDVPTIDAIFVRAVPLDLGGADLSEPVGGVPVGSTDIDASVDLIVHCRDTTGAERIPDSSIPRPKRNAPFALDVVDSTGLHWPVIRFEHLDNSNSVGQFYARQSLTAKLPHKWHYLLYLRQSIIAYDRRGGPVTLDVTVRDYRGYATSLQVTVGATVTVLNPPVANAYVCIVRITNALEGLWQVPEGVETAAGAIAPARQYNGDNFYIGLEGAPVGWTVSPARQLVAHGAAVNVHITFDPHGNSPVGTHTFDVVVSSGILLPVGTHVPVTVSLI